MGLLVVEFMGLRGLLKAFKIYCELIVKEGS